MAKTSEHMRQVAGAIAAMGKTLKACSGDPGSGASAANVIATTPAQADTTWGAAQDGSGADVGSAVVVGSAVNFQVPSNTTVSHYAVFDGSGKFLRGQALQASVTVNANGPVAVEVTPRLKYS